MTKNREDEKPKRDIWEPREPNDAPLTPGSHEQLWQIAIKLPTDYEPCGQMKRDSFADFRYLDIDCCETCHTLCPHYEMYLEELPLGRKAWICCRVLSAFFGPGHQSDHLRENFLDLERALGFEAED